MQLQDGSITYEFKLADFGLGLVFRPGLRPAPIPQALSSPNQNPKFSTSEYGPDDDLYGIGYMMTLMQTIHLLTRCHPDPEYQNLYVDLMHDPPRREIDDALHMANTKYQQMTNLSYWGNQWMGSGLAN